MRFQNFKSCDLEERFPFWLHSLSFSLLPPHIDQALLGRPTLSPPHIGQALLERPTPLHIHIHIASKLRRISWNGSQKFRRRSHTTERHPRYHYSTLWNMFSQRDQHLCWSKCAVDFCVVTSDFSWFGGDQCKFVPIGSTRPSQSLSPGSEFEPLADILHWYTLQMVV